MLNKTRKMYLILCAALIMLCVSCSSGDSHSSVQFETIQQKITKGEPLSTEEQAEFDRLNNANAASEMQVH